MLIIEARLLNFFGFWKLQYFEIGNVEATK